MKRIFTGQTNITTVKNGITLDRNSEALTVVGDMLKIVNTSTNTSRLLLFNTDARSLGPQTISLEGILNAAATAEKLAVGLVIQHNSSTPNFLSMYGLYIYYTGGNWTLELAEIEALADAPTVSVASWAITTGISISDYYDFHLEYSFARIMGTDGTVTNTLIMELYKDGVRLASTANNAKSASFSLGVGGSPSIIGPGVMLITGATASAEISLRMLSHSGSAQGRSLSG
jgi:hypothetical protein